MGFVFLSTFDELRVYKAELEHMQWLLKMISLSLFGKISLNEQYGPRHFLKIGVEKKANKHPWL